jgi:hypothetical protein
MAESWRLVDELTWEFKLRHGVKFHNGEPFSAATVKYNVRRVMNPDQKSPQRGNIAWIDRVDIVDDYTVRLVTKEPHPIVPERLTNFQMVPVVYSKEVGDTGFAKKPVGTGPYRLESWTKRQQIVLEANTEYWKGPPAVKTVIFRTLPETATQIDELLAGGVDIIRTVPPDQIALIERGDCTFGTKVLNAEAAGAVGVALYNNQGGPPVSPGGPAIDSEPTPMAAQPLLESNPAHSPMDRALDGQPTGRLLNARTTISHDVPDDLSYHVTCRTIHGVRVHHESRIVVDLDNHQLLRVTGEPVILHDHVYATVVKTGDGTHRLEGELQDGRMGVIHDLGALSSAGQVRSTAEQNVLPGFRDRLGGEALTCQEFLSGSIDAHSIGWLPEVWVELA